MNEEPVVVFSAQGTLEETQVRSFLAAHGIPTATHGEALRKTHGLTLDGLGQVARIHAADHAAKAAKVHLLDVKVVLPGGKGYVSMTGNVGAVRTAVGAGISVVPEGMLVGHLIIPAPDTQLLKTMGK